MPTVSQQQLVDAGRDTQTIADIANSQADTTTDRPGRTRRTLTGVINWIVAQAQVVLGGLGYLPPVAYAAGIVISNTRQTVTRSGVTYAANADAVPFTTSGTFETAKFRVIQGVTGADLGAATGSTLVGTSVPGIGGILRNTRDKLREYPSDGDYSTLRAAVEDNYGKKLLYTGIRPLTVDSLFIEQPITLSGWCGDELTPGVVMDKKANTAGIVVTGRSVTLENLWVRGSKGGELGFTDTTDGIVWGQNDGANGENVANGYKNAQRGCLRNVTVNRCGRDNVSWQEGHGLILENVAALEAGRRNFEVSDKAFDASHGDWFAFSAGAVGDGFSIKWGAHNFRLLKSFSDGDRGVYLNKARGCAGNVFVELSGGAFLQFGPDTGANDIFVQFWTTGKNYVDEGGIGNVLRGMSLGNNSGGMFQNFTRTGRLLIKSELVQQGEPTFAGGLAIEQTSNTTFPIGDNAYMCGLEARTGGMYLRGMAIGHKIFDARGFGSVSLDAGNRYIDTWLLNDAQNLALGTGYDGQTVTVYHLGGGAASSVSGPINGGVTTVPIAGVNDSLTLTYIAASGFWFVRK